VVFRHFHAKNDKEKIVAWKSDLNRILQVFNVRSIVSARSLLTWHSQTELALNTHVAVSNTQIMVSEIHRTVVHGHEGSDGKKPSVSDSCTPVVAECPLTVA